MKLVYKPFAIIATLLGAKLGESAFKGVWSLLDDESPPTPTTADTSWSKMLIAAVLGGATTAGVAAAVDRAGAAWFHYLTGIWPGKESVDAD